MIQWSGIIMDGKAGEAYQEYMKHGKTHLVASTPTSDTDFNEAWSSTE